MRTFYYRLLRLVALSIHPVFVFDGPNKPPFKRNKRTGPNVASIPEFLAKQLLKQFGYPIHLAPGEAEAECALLQREGIVDAVLSEDVDTLMFGSGITIRNWSPETTGKTPTHVNVYDAVETKNGPSGLDREGMILVALMSGGDYVPEGIPGCGPKTACEAAKAGFGHDLCKIPRSDTHAMRAWRERLQHELKTNESKLFKRRHTTLKIPEDFPRLDILGYYTHPAISSQSGLDKLRRSICWDQDLDLPGLRDFTHDAFDWVRLEGAKHFIRSLAPSLVVRQLRLRSQQIERLPTNDIQAVQEDEALLIKGIHGRRQHPVTDNSVELRISFTPIELVKIDLSKEDPDDEPDDEPANSQVGDVDLEDDVALDLEDDGPKKRGPTKFDPKKPARIWVLETFVKVGVPLKVQDWEAERQNKLKPKRTATTERASKSATSRAKGNSKKTKAAIDMPQPPIQQFAKVTKPGSTLSRNLAKAQNSGSAQPASSPQSAAQAPIDIVDLLSSSPPINRPAAPTSRIAREKSLTPILEDLPPSVTKRRRRAPMQRAHTVPSNINSDVSRSKTPPPLDTVETLDLLSSPVAPSPSHLPLKKTKTRARDGPVVRQPRATSVASSPGKTKQTTLDAWRASATPTKLRTTAFVPAQPPIPAPPEFCPPGPSVDELDLTLSSPTGKAFQSKRPTDPSSPCQSKNVASVRPPLTSRSSNASQASSKAKSSRSPTETNPTRRTSSRRTSPRLRKTKSASPELEHLDLTSTDLEPVSTKPLSPKAVDIFDLTALSSPPPVQAPIQESSHSPATPPSQLPSPTVRRSPRDHSTSSPQQIAQISPPAAWKAREKKKRQIILRQSVVGAWDFVDIDSPGPTSRNDSEEIPKGKARRKWRESEVEVLDLS